MRSRTGKYHSKQGALTPEYKLQENVFGTCWESEECCWGRLAGLRLGKNVFPGIRNTQTHSWERSWALWEKQLKSQKCKDGWGQEGDAAQENPREPVPPSSRADRQLWSEVRMFQSWPSRPRTEECLSQFNHSWKWRKETVLPFATGPNGVSDPFHVDSSSPNSCPPFCQFLALCQRIPSASRLP